MSDHTAGEKPKSVRESWDAYSDEYYRTYNTEEILSIIGQDPWRAFPGRVRAMIEEALPELKGKRVLVPSSGDNHAAFAFSLLGARVTSADLSQRQIINARAVAEKRGWKIDFVCDDSMSLGTIGGEYDLVYTSNGVHVWIPDLARMYASFYRVLRQGGAYVMFETHPFIRPFDDSGPEIRVVKPYEETGPHGETPEYAWRVSDLFNAMVSARFTVGRMEEFHPSIGDLSAWWYRTPAEGRADNWQKIDWRRNVWAALPQWIGFSAKKQRG